MTDILHNPPAPPWLINAVVMFCIFFVVIAVFYFVTKRKNDDELDKKEDEDWEKDQLSKIEHFVPTPIGIVTYACPPHLASSVRAKILELINGKKDVVLQNYEKHIGAKIIKIDPISPPEEDDDTMPIGKQN